MKSLEIIEKETFEKMKSLCEIKIIHFKKRGDYSYFSSCFKASIQGVACYPFCWFNYNEIKEWTEADVLLKQLPRSSRIKVFREYREWHKEKRTELFMNGRISNPE